MTQTLLKQLERQFARDSPILSECIGFRDRGTTSFAFYLSEAGREKGPPVYLAVARSWTTTAWIFFQILNLSLRLSNIFCLALGAGFS